MKKIKSNQLKNYVGKILLIKSKQLKLETYFDNGPITDDDYDFVDRYYLLNSVDLQSANLAPLDFYADFCNGDIVHQKTQIAIVDFDTLEISCFLLNKKDLSKIKKKALFELECVEDAISSYQKKKKKLQEAIKILK